MKSLVSCLCALCVFIPTLNAHQPSAPWFGDGNVDLYVSNYETWKDNTYPHPHLLYRNLGGDKGFELWWESKGDQVLPGRGVTFLDVDGDGKPEIYVSNYRLAPNFLWFHDP